MPNQTTLASQQFVEIKAIKDKVVHLKSGGMRKVLMVGGINFDLKSGEEQEAILKTFQNFLNTLDFSVQFFIHSRKVNIDDYIKKMQRRKSEEENELLKIQIDDYAQFIKSFVEQNPIVSKVFFVVVPYDPVAVPSKAKSLLGMFKKSPSKEKVEGRVEAKKGVLQLNQRVDEVVSGLEALGIHTNPLDDEELTELFYNLYNPQLTDKDLEITKVESEYENKNPTSI